MRDLTHIVVHHSVTPQYQDIDEAVERISREHQERLHPDANGFGLHVAYHYIIDAKGNTRNTRPLSEIGYHAGNWEINEKSVGICILGNYENDTPTKDSLDTLAALSKEITRVYGVETVCGHRDIKATACPGENLYPHVATIMDREDPLRDWANSVGIPADTPNAIVEGMHGLFKALEQEYNG